MNARHLLRRRAENLDPACQTVPWQRASRLRLGVPALLHQLIDRESELSQIETILRTSTDRLLTLTGPPGVGKTRLAIEAAVVSTDAFDDGVVFVDLSPLRDPELVLPTITMALGVHEVHGYTLFESVTTFLAQRQMLLVLDNLEHLLDAAPLLPRLLHAAARVKALVTSREPLRVRGERTYPVRPLPIPEANELMEVEAVAQNAAVNLFIERVRDGRPEFAVTNENARPISEICRRMDGLPLAIELAAPYLNVLSPEALATRLSRRLPLLRGGTRDAPERQRTLRDAISWSYSLLSPEEQRLFQRLGVFVGDWTLEATEAIAADDGDSTCFMTLSLLSRQEPGAVRWIRYLACLQDADHDSGVRRRAAGGQ